MEWPSFFPPQCPPTEAVDASVEVFRLVSSNPPAASDFESYAEMYPNKWEGNCEASGLSVFTGKDDALRLARRVPGLSALGNLIATASLTPASGKLKYTPRNGNSHHTWWAPEGLDHASAFKVVT